MHGWAHAHTFRNEYSNISRKTDSTTEYNTRTRHLRPLFLRPPSIYDKVSALFFFYRLDELTRRISIFEKLKKKKKIK